ncbi:MAG: hypothetical protein ACYSYW_14025, partial [Planctomycetota bacterium]
VDSFTVDNDTQITAQISIASDATLGGWGIYVVNPWDYATVGFEVLDLLPEDMVNNIIENIALLNLPTSTKQSLMTSLNTSVKVLRDSNPNNDGAAINTLQAFINKIEAQRGKRITEVIADALIAEAKAIVHALNSGK